MSLDHSSTDRLSGSRIVELLRNDTERGECFDALWLVVDQGSRDELQSEVLQARGEFPVVPLVVRERGFDDPNSVLNDLLRIINSHRAEFEKLATPQRSVRLLLLARDRLRIPQVSSPVTLPEWFPGCGGKVVDVEIRDFSTRMDASLASPELRTADLGRLLFQLETELVRLVSASAGRGQNNVMALAAALKREEKESFPEVLEGAKRFIETSKHADGYRPSLKEKGSLLARLLFKVSKTPPDQLPALGTALARGLGLGEGIQPTRSVYGLLFRPPPPMPAPDALFCHNLAITAYAAYQLTTAAAHAADYPGFPIGVLVAVASDLRRSLGAIVGELTRHT